MNQLAALILVATALVVLWWLNKKGEPPQGCLGWYIAMIVIAGLAGVVMLAIYLFAQLMAVKT